MPSSTRSRSKDSLLKSTLKKQWGNSPSPSGLRTRSSKSESFANTEEQHRTESGDTDSNIGRKSSRRKATLQNRTCPAVASKNSGSHSISASVEVVSADEEEDVVSATDVKTAVKTAVDSKRRKSMLPDNAEVANKENIDANDMEEASPTSKKYDTRKSIDHVTKRKNLSRTINDYTPEELKKACLNADDAITELQMKYKSLLTMIKESEQIRQLCFDAQQRCRYLQNQRDELEHKNEVYEKVTRNEDRSKIQALSIENAEMRQKIEEQFKEISQLRKNNTELQENVSSLSTQIVVLQQTEQERQNWENKSDKEIFILKKENNNHKEEIHRLNQTLKELRDQVQVLEELNNKLRKERESLEQSLKEQDKERTNLSDQMHKEVGDMEAWKTELVSRTEDMELQLNHLEDAKRRLEVKISSLVKKNEEYEGVNRRLKECQHKLEESNQKTVHEFELQLNHLEDAKRRLEVKISSLVKKNEEYEGVNRRLKEYQHKLEESNQKTLHEFEKNLDCQEQDVLTLLVPHMQTDSPTYFFVQDTVKTWIKNSNDNPNLMALYKELICNLQDVTDFYSLLCGVSIWKVEEETKSIDRYHCQLNPVLGCGNYRFVMKVHSEEGTVSYCADAVEIESLKYQLPKGLMNPTTFQSDRAFVFFRNILEHLESI